MQQICVDLYIENENTTRKNTADYKEILIQACHRKNESILRGLSEGKEKCQWIGKEEYGIKEYLQKKYMADVRNTSRTKYGQMDFAGNFSKNKKYSKTSSSEPHRELNLHLRKPFKGILH